MKKNRAVLTLLLTIVLTGLLLYTAAFGWGKQRAEQQRISSWAWIWQAA